MPRGIASTWWSTPCGSGSVTSWRRTCTMSLGTWSREVPISTFASLWCRDLSAVGCIHQDISRHIKCFPWHLVTKTRAKRRYGKDRVKDTKGSRFSWLSLTFWHSRHGIGETHSRWFHVVLRGITAVPIGKRRQLRCHISGSQPSFTIRNLSATVSPCREVVYPCHVYQSTRPNWTLGWIWLNIHVLVKWGHGTTKAAVLVKMMLINQQFLPHRHPLWPKILRFFHWLYHRVLDPDRVDQLQIELEEQKLKEEGRRDLALTFV